MTHTDMDINWNMFTYDRDWPPSRYVLCKPFVRDGYRYATDGRIMVRVPSTEPNTSGKLPPTADIGWLHGTVTEWIDWPMDRDDEPTLMRAACGGCGECGHTGTHYYVDHDHAYPLTDALNIGWLYAKRIAMLPKVQFAVVEPDRYDHPIVLFRFGENGEGILMPLG